MYLFVVVRVINTVACNSCSLRKQVSECAMFNLIHACAMHLVQFTWEVRKLFVISDGLLGFLLINLHVLTISLGLGCCLCP